MLDRILLASSLSEADPTAVLDAYERSTRTEPAEESADEHPQRRLAAVAAQVREEALRRLLDAARDELSASGPSRGVRGFALERPRRGRRAAARDETGTGAVA